MKTDDVVLLSGKCTEATRGLKILEIIKQELNTVNFPCIYR